MFDRPTHARGYEEVRDHDERQQGADKHGLFEGTQPQLVCALCYPAAPWRSSHSANAAADRRSNCAFTATMTVLSDMSTAPTAGESTIPHGARTPAASGMATLL